LTDGRGAAVWAAAGEAGLVVVATVRHRHLAAIGALSAALPSTAVALDHGGFVEPDRPAAADALLGLAALPSVHVKLTTHNLGGGAAARPWLAKLVGAFGVDRLCWGSDFPQVQTMAYPQLLRAAQEATADLGDEDRELFFSTTSTNLWWP
jgi:L-fuconolactonase